MASGSRRAVAASSWHALVSSCVTDSIHCWIFLCLRSWGMGDSVRMDSIHFGQNARFNFLTAHGYHWHAQEYHRTLGLSLIRPANSFTTDSSKEAVMRDENLLTAERYGSANRVYVIVDDDFALPVGFSAA
ncbi:hypothetical protein BRADI_2g27434v3 [Brachypodium distachyon]|uniref:Uncharacterized protein n=1 Tax=Brachypodium distachyon TaxID=15368 RepID=A0A0Q3G5M3_BRADI|nr:hypothetical protein BRADI_2g27434v3 [Brachypodium distachyon]